MAPTGGRTAQRLGAEDWVQAALDIMIEHGIGGVKIYRLCERLGVTKGSFYWHFADLDTFLSEVARRWADDGAHIPGTIDETASPSEQLLAAMRLFAEPRNRHLARAMRDWAQHDDRARAAIHRADEALYERIRDALLKCDFDHDEAEVRAKILYYSGVGYAHVGPLGSTGPGTDHLLETWQLLTQR
jgi:AcrR family transcriptional regulator